jgi:hypothetical protein
MKLTNTRLGWYYFPDHLHYTQVDLDTWLPLLETLGARWLTLQANVDFAIPESFIRGLCEADIEPIVHIPFTVGNIVNADLSPILSSYCRWGVRYVVIGDRPNLKSNWGISDWGRTGLVERFIDQLLPILQMQQSTGLQPIFPPLEPGGDYWDTAFLEAALESISRRGKQDLLNSLTIAIYAWTYAKPLDWGKGGPSIWPEARPYHTPPGCQDQIGLHIFDWYAHTSEKVAGSQLPMLVVAGGELPGDEARVLSTDPHVEQNLGIVRSLANGDVPDSVLNFSFYHLSSSPEAPDHHAAWFPSVDRPLPVVAALKRLPYSSVKQPQAAIRKPLNHYLLLPEPSYPLTNQEWNAIWPFVVSLKPVVGFSASEARKAQRVTIFGNEDSIPKSIEQELLTAGCTVDRYNGPQRNNRSTTAYPTLSFAQYDMHLSSSGDQDV